jgi:hypothetical protein
VTVSSLAATLSRIQQLHAEYEVLPLKDFSLETQRPSGLTPSRTVGDGSDLLILTVTLRSPLQLIVLYCQALRASLTDRELRR